MILPEDIDLYTESDPKLKRIGYDYSVIPADDYTTPRTYMKWEHIEETETTLFNLMYAWIGFNIKISQTDGTAILNDMSDDISLRQNMWSWFNRQECYMSKINIFNQKDYGHVSEQMMSLLRFSPSNIDHTNSMIYFSPDETKQYSLCRSSSSQSGSGFPIKDDVAATLYQGFTRVNGLAAFNQESFKKVITCASADNNYAGLPDGIKAHQFAGWKIIINVATDNAKTAAFNRWKGRVLTVVDNLATAAGVVAFLLDEDLPATVAAGPPESVTIDAAGTIKYINGFLTPKVSVKGSELVADEVIRTYNFAGQLSRRLFLPLKSFCSCNFFQIDQMMKKLTTKLRFDLASPDQLVVRGAPNARTYKVEILNADLYLPFANFGNMETKHQFYNLTSSREEIIYRCQTQYDALSTTTNNIIKLGDFSTVDEKLEYIIVGLKDNNYSWDYNPMTFSDCGLTHLEVKIDSIIAPYFKPTYGKATYFDDLYFEFCQCRDKFFSRGGANVPVDILDKFPSIDLSAWRNNYPIICIDARRYMIDMKSVGDKINVSLRLRVGNASVAYTTAITSKKITFGFSETRDTTITA